MIDKGLIGRIATVTLFVTLSVLGIAFSMYLLYIANSAYMFILALAFTALSLLAGFFNIYASIWYYRSYFYDRYLERIRNGLKPLGKELPDIAVAMPVFNEDASMVEDNIKSLLTMNYPKSKMHFYIADDSTDPMLREAIEKLAKKYKAKYSHRNERKGFKAGALNNALLKASEEFIAIFDSDEKLVDRNFLVDLLPFFQDKSISYVQTEKRYQKGNFFSDAVDIFDAFFFKFIQPARAINNTAIFSGSCGLIRTSAFRDIGGLPEFIIEDTFFSFESDMHGYKSLHVPKVYALGRPVKTFTELAKQQWRYNYGDTQFIGYFFKRKGFTKRTPLSNIDYTLHGLGLNYLSVVLLMFTIVSAGIVFSAAPFAHFDLMNFLTQNQLSVDLEVLGFLAFTLSLMTPIFLARAYFGSWSKGAMVFLLNYALVFVRTKAALDTFVKKNVGIQWNRRKDADARKGLIYKSLHNTKTEIAFSSSMFGLAAVALWQTNLAGGIWLIWYGILYSLTTAFLVKYG